MSDRGPLLSAGTTLSGRWQLDDFLGSAENGEVYGVRDLHGSGSFAAKIFWPNALRQPELWTALQQAARTASGLGVEGVARAYDFGIDANSGRPFVVAERVSWPALGQRVRQRGPLAPAELGRALTVLARALDAAHSVGLVHRDLKPDNVFISPDNPHWVRVSDFGVSALRAASAAPSGWAAPIGWAAPEAADAKVQSTPAMDVYALGLVSFFALCGGALHRAARALPIDANALWQELSTPLDSAAQRARELGVALDSGFDAWFQRATATQPQERFASVGEMVNAFQGVVRALPAQSQNTVLLPGVAAAIAQPLIFQPEPAAVAIAAAAPPPQPPTLLSPQYAETAPSSQKPEASKRRAGPLWVAGGALLLVLGAGAAFAMHGRNAAPLPPLASAAAESPPVATSGAALPATASATPSPAISASATPSATAASAPAVSAEEPAHTTPRVKAPPTLAPPATAKLASSAKLLTTKATATTKPAASAKPAPSSSTSTAKTPPKSSTVLAAPLKKKCGSVFIPCK